MSRDEKVMTLLWRSALSTSITELVLLPKFDNSSPSVTQDKKFVTWLWANDSTTSWGGVPKGILSKMLTYWLNSMFLASLWLEKYRFSNWSFCWLWAYLFPFTEFGQVTVILLSLGNICHKKQWKPSQFDENSRTKFRIWHFSNYFQWFNQRESRTGFLSQ